MSSSLVPVSEGNADEYVRGCPPWFRHIGKYHTSDTAVTRIFKQVASEVSYYAFASILVAGKGRFCSPLDANKAYDKKHMPKKMKEAVEFLRHASGEELVAAVAEILPESWDMAKTCDPKTGSVTVPETDELAVAPCDAELNAVSLQKGGGGKATCNFAACHESSRVHWSNIARIGCVMTTTTLSVGFSADPTRDNSVVNDTSATEKTFTENVHVDGAVYGQFSLNGNYEHEQNKIHEDVKLLKKDPLQAHRGMAISPCITGNEIMDASACFSVVGAVIVQSCMIAMFVCSEKLDSKYGKWFEGSVKGLRLESVYDRCEEGDPDFLLGTLLEPSTLFNHKDAHAVWPLSMKNLGGKACVPIFPFKGYCYFKQKPLGAANLRSHPFHAAAVLLNSKVSDMVRKATALGERDPYAYVCSQLSSVKKPVRLDPGLTDYINEDMYVEDLLKSREIAEMFPTPDALRTFIGFMGPDGNEIEGDAEKRVYGVQPYSCTFGPVDGDARAPLHWCVWSKYCWRLGVYASGCIGMRTTLLVPNKLAPTTWCGSLRFGMPSSLVLLRSHDEVWSAFSAFKKESAKREEFVAATSVDTMKISALLYRKARMDPALSSDDDAYDRVKASIQVWATAMAAHPEFHITEDEVQELSFEELRQKFSAISGQRSLCDAASDSKPACDDDDHPYKKAKVPKSEAASGASSDTEE
jgi:hypothetical protein